jgi:hypothetical protein
MALDPYLSALQLRPERLIDAARLACAGGFEIVCERRLTVTLIARTADDAITSGPLPFAQSPSASIYRQLDDLGVVAVAGDIAKGDISLTGGSICSCALSLDGARWRVKKSIAASLLTRLDADDRHAGEFRILSRMQSDAPLLFPPVGAAAAATQIELRFLPYYTLGELFVQGRADSQGALSVIDHIFSALRKWLYHEATSVQRETYLDKVTRRLDELVRKSRRGVWYERLYAYGATVNGQALPPIKDMIARIKASSAAQTALKSPTPRLCHGDLIPEDILVDAVNGGFCLLDPNPQIGDPLADLAKLVMSCEVQYDLALRDLIECRATSGRRLEITYAAPAFHEGYTAQQKEIAAALAQRGQALLGAELAPDERARPASIRLLAGLQAMAISLFHSVHHRKEARALYFTVKGQQLVESALSDLD